MSVPAFSLVPPPALNDYEVYFNGVTFGGVNNAVDLVPMVKVEGLGEPNIRSADTPRALADGELPGLDFLSGRDITFTIVPNGYVAQYLTPLQQIEAGLPTPPTLEDLLVDLAAATNPLGSGAFTGQAVESPLWIQLPNLPLLCTMARCRKRTFTADINYVLARGMEMSMMFHATDPILYGLTSQARPSFAATVDIDAYNSGNYATAPTLLITGPANTPMVRNANPGGEPYLKFDLTLAAGDTLAVDMQAQSVIYTPFSTGIPKPGLYFLDPASEWWNLTPGPNTIVTSCTGSLSGTCQVQWASGYML